MPPCWESKSDWADLQGIAEETSKLAPKYFSGPVKDILVSPLMHDTPAEIAQPTVKDWAKGECELIPGKTAPNIKIVTRDYANLLNRFVSVGPNFRNNGLSVHGTHYDVDDAYDAYLQDPPHREVGRQGVSVACATTRTPAMSSSTSPPKPTARWPTAPFRPSRVKTGIDHTHLAADTRGGALHVRGPLHPAAAAR